MFWDLSNTSWSEVCRVSRAWEFLMAWKDKRKLAEGSRQEEFEEFLRDQVSKTPPSYCEIYGLHISEEINFLNKKEAISPIRSADFFCSSTNCKSSILWRLNCPFWKGSVIQTDLWIVMVYHYSSGSSCETKKRLSVEDPMVWFLWRETILRRSLSKNCKVRTRRKSVFSSKRQKYSMGLKVNISLGFKLCAWNRVQ